RAAVGVEQPHRGGAIAQLEENQSIGADASVPRAEMSREFGEIADLKGPRRASINQQEIVAVRMSLGDRQLGRHGTWKAVKTYVTPVVKPTLGSSFVAPSSSPASPRHPPLV